MSTEELHYGLRLSVVALPAPPQLTTAEALAVVGPEAFGLGSNAQYRPTKSWRRSPHQHAVAGTPAESC